MAKQVTCGVLLWVDNELLITRPTWLTKGYDIPKKIKEPDENEVEAALKALKEEANIALPDGTFKAQLGRFKYQPNKDIYLIMAILSEKPKNIKCNSTWLPPKGIEELNVLQFQWKTFDDSQHFLFKSLSKVMQEIKPKIDWTAEQYNEWLLKQNKDGQDE